MKKSISLNNKQAVLIHDQLVRTLINERVGQVLWRDKDKEITDITWEDVEEAKAYSDDLELAVMNMLPKVAELEVKPTPAKEIYEEVIASRIKSSKKKQPKRAKLV